MLDPMETIPMPRNSRRKREIPIVTHAIILIMVLRARETDPPDRAENAGETVRGPKTRETSTLQSLSI